LEGYGIRVVDRVSIETDPQRENMGYLKTKKKKLGHLLSIKASD
jgi:3,4-dihydroxy 2-butanone 4-phosphate synthase/GTP cyclohydrolase II